MSLPTACRAGARIKILFAGLFAGWTVAAGASAAAFKDKLSGAELLDALKSGGLVIFIRHAETARDYADQVSAVMGECSTQRPLSEAGWQQARAIGKAFEALRIPVGEVYSSEYCRAWQTADLAFGRYRKTPDLNFAPAEEYSDEQIAAMRERMALRLAASPKDGINTVLVGHDDPFEAATGIYPQPMGVGPRAPGASPSLPTSQQRSGPSWPDDRLSLPPERGLAARGGTRARTVTWRNGSNLPGRP
jgi:phosphohistidine phosphatase SixA